MLAELVDHVIGVDPDRDRITAVIVDSTKGELDQIEAPREAVSAMLGHRSMRMTLVYGRIADRTVADEYFAAADKTTSSTPPT